MTDLARPAPVFLTPFSQESLGMCARAGSGTVATAAWPTVNKVFYVPFVLASPITVNRFFWANGTTASTNNMQVGVYDASGNSIKIGTATPASGASQPQFDNVADFSLAAGRLYYMACWGSGTTTHILRAAGTTRIYRGMGMFEQTGQSSTMPNTATFAVCTAAYLPLFGLALRASP